MLDHRLRRWSSNNPAYTQCPDVFDGNVIARDKLSLKQDQLSQCRIDVGQLSATLAQHEANIGSMYRVWGSSFISQLS